MDNLRAFAMLLGVVFHAALAYGPALNQVWPTASSQYTAGMDMFAFFTHTFRMPLFFVIAGFFAAMLVEKKGLVGMIKNRLRRVTLPFVIFLPLVIFAFIVVIGWGIENVENKSSILTIISYAAQNPDAPQPPLTTSHLWFLYNLTFFYLLTMIAVKWIKVDSFKWVLKSPLVFVLVFPLLLVPALLTQHAPIPAPEKFTPQLWSFGFYGVFYWLGWGVFKHQALLDSLKSYQWPMLLISVVAYVGFYSLIPHSMSLEESMALAAPPELSLKQFGVASLEAYIGLYMSLCLLIFGRHYFNQSSVVVKFIADSSYWVYIIHLPVLWLIQFRLLDTQYSLMSQLLISTLGTLVIGFITYLVFVRWTPIGWLLNGRKKRQKS
jgi:peptidoglycan/LPS O-acetylase OafA/YrhL